ncbi:MAG: hypothetical protein MR030_00525 [Bacteroidales bacterium]|nr:hypothetical protein [Bacteroidales bacterium]
MEYDENIAIKQIRKVLSDKSNTIYDDDEILNVIDMIWDFYDENGMLDIDLEDGEDDSEAIYSELCDYVVRMLKKDKEAKILPEDVPAIVKAEVDYELSLEEGDLS